MRFHRFDPTNRPPRRLLGASLVAGCVALGGLHPVASAAPGGGGGAPDLVDANAAAGLANMFTSSNTGHSGGAAWIDYNGDYWPDLFLTNGSGFQHVLYRNDGDGTFTDVSSLVAKPSALLESAGVAFADVDNDGDSDLLVVVDNPVLTGSPPPATGGPNLLYLNDGSGTFSSGASAAGVVDPLGRRNVAAGFADFDRDGWIDLFLAHWQPNSAAATNYDRLLRNDGDGTYTDVSAGRRVNGYGRDTLASLWFDSDMDGWIDLYLGCVGDGSLPDSGDVLYMNCNGGLRFCNTIGDPHKLGDDAPAARGLDVGDVDNDGDWDLYIADQSAGPPAPVGNVLYLANGDGTFQDNACDTAGVCATDSWACNFADFDRDGWIDLWVGTADAADPELLYLNDGDGTFTSAPATGFTGHEVRGGSVADYDGDGDVDLVLVNDGQDSVLMRNDATDTNHWLEVKLLGVASNRDAIGATVRVTAGGVTQMRRVSGGDSAHSQQDLILHFGLGAQVAADVTVVWPNGTPEPLGSVAADQLAFVREGSGVLVETLTASSATYSASAQELTVQVSSLFGGRTGFDVATFGPLSYDASSIEFSATFAAVSASPGTVTVDSVRGGSFVVPVTDVP